MPWLDVIWDDSPGGNVEHVAATDVTVEEVEEVLRNPSRRTTSRSSGRPMVQGYTSAGRAITVVYEGVDDVTVLPITAYEPSPP